MAVVELYARDVGSGPPVVLLHAFPLSSAMWLPQREALAGSYRVVTPDQRGFGGSPLGDDEPSLDAVADDVAALLDAKELDRVVLGGLSMGGYVALAFWRRHRDRVRALVLADTRAEADTEDGKASRERIATALEADAESPVLLDEVLPKLVGATTVEKRPLVYGRVRGFVQAAPPAAVAWAERAMAARPDSTPDLGSVDVPVLVLVGEEDVLTPPPLSETLAAGAPGARLVRLAGAGHLSSVESPEEFNAAVEEFLRGL